MSEYTERTDIISIDEIPPIPEVHADMVNLKELSNYKPLDVVLTDLKSFIPDNILGTINAVGGGLDCSFYTTAIISPNSLRASFQSTFSPSLRKLESNRISNLMAKKASLILALRKTDFKISANTDVKIKLQAIFNTKDVKSANTQIKSLMQILETSHTEVFTSNIANACAIASQNTGFRQVNIKSVNGKLEVIATNSHGQRLGSEISVDPTTNIVNVNSDTIGITDGSCVAIMKKFNEELRKMNIKIGKEKSIYTGGSCQMTYTQIIDKQDKEAKRHKSEQERMMKLNNNQKQRI